MRCSEVVAFEITHALPEVRQTIIEVWMGWKM
jgi:hypothetical protein